MFSELFVSGRFVVLVVVVVIVVRFQWYVYAQRTLRWRLKVKTKLCSFKMETVLYKIYGLPLCLLASKCQKEINGLTMKN